MELGLSGGPNSAEKRLALMKRLDLPEHMSANALLQALNMLYSLEELADLVQTIS
jgi:ribonuclease M5